MHKAGKRSMKSMAKPCVVKVKYLCRCAYVSTAINNDVLQVIDLTRFTLPIPLYRCLCICFYCEQQITAASLESFARVWVCASIEQPAHTTHHTVADGSTLTTACQSAAQPVHRLPSPRLTHELKSPTPPAPMKPDLNRYGFEPRIYFFEKKVVIV